MSVWKLSSTQATSVPVVDSRPAKPTLWRVPTWRPRPLTGLSFAFVMVAILVAGVVGGVALSTSLQDQSFKVKDAQQQAAELGNRVSDLEAQVARAEAPSQIAGRASRLGMVPNPYPVYVDLASGAVVGAPQVVLGSELPSLKVPPAAVNTRWGSSATIAVHTSVLPWLTLPQPPSASPSPSGTPSPSGSPSTAPASPKPSATKSTAKPTTTSKPTVKKTPTR